mgnify:CR=1 FL=1
MLSKEASITGVQVNYYFICKTKLWLFSHFASMEHTSDTVALGKLLHKGSYKREKELKLERISLDFVKKRGIIVIHEVKKSRKLEKAHIYQLLYYLYYLKQKGIEAMGEINYPLLRKKEKIELKDEHEREIKEILSEIASIIRMEKPPKPEKKKYCRKCSYFELCWVT